jgi:hypothetical protein
MSTVLGRGPFVCACIASLLGSLTCDGSAINEDELTVAQDELGAKPSPQALKKLARNFRISATEPLQLLTRSGRTVAVPLSALVVEIEIAPSPVTATASRAPVMVAPEIPPTPSRGQQPATFTADVPCAGVATRARVPVPTVSFPDVPPDEVPRAVRVPSIVVAPSVEGMPVVATRVRVPVQEVEVPPPPTAARNRKPVRKMVTIPEITLGLIDAGDPAAATSIEVRVPGRTADEAAFHAVRVK